MLLMSFANFVFPVKIMVVVEHIIKMERKKL